MCRPEQQADSSSMEGLRAIHLGRGVCSPDEPPRQPCRLAGISSLGLLTDLSSGRCSLDGFDVYRISEAARPGLRLWKDKYFAPCSFRAFHGLESESRVAGSCPRLLLLSVKSPPRDLDPQRAAVARSWEPSMAKCAAPLPTSLLGLATFHVVFFWPRWRISQGRRRART